jgi:hypothetical protein
MNPWSPEDAPPWTRCIHSLYSEATKSFTMAEQDPDGAGHYNNGHRAFLQSFFARPTLTFAEAKPILAKILSIQGTH